MYLNAGFGAPIGGEDLRLIARLGFSGVRQDVPTGRAWDLVPEFSYSGLSPLFLVGGGKMPDEPEVYVHTAYSVAACMAERGVRGAIEIGNEPDITGYGPVEFAALVRQASDAIWDVDVRIPVVSGGIMTTNERGLDYLRIALETELIPPDVIVGYHTYRAGPPDESAPGFHNRASEFHRLLNLVGDRRIWNTEIGWHDAEFKRRRGIPLCFLSQTKRYSEQEVFGFLVRERELNVVAGAEVMVVYQFQDGPSEKQADHFGIRRLDGTLKPSAKIAEVV